MLILIWLEYLEIYNQSLWYNCIYDSWSGQPYQKEVDLWGLGMILLVMLRGKLPFNSKYQRENIKWILNPNMKLKDSVWNKISE